MAEFFSEVDIRQDQAEAIARGLFTVARADGQIHERETALIGEFFASASEGASNLGALERATPIDGATLAQLLPTESLRQLFLKTALLVAYVDNKLGEAEAKLIRDYASALGISTPELETLETQVKEFLLSQLSHLSNVDEVAKVARELKP
jgi:tellurite resistance protein